jgi:transcriptional regulator GlxA family with amidase domain
MITIGIPAYEGVDLLDNSGPYDKKLRIYVLSEHGRSVTTGSGLVLTPHRSFADVRALDVLWVPGGLPDALGRIMRHRDGPYLSYLRQAGESASWVCSVCEGALLLARAGLLDGHRATTHWAFTQCLKRFSKVEVEEGNPRFVLSGNRLTGAGISSGLDESLRLIELLAGTDVATFVQQQTQYFPEPPVQGTIPPPPAECPVHW